MIPNSYQIITPKWDHLKVISYYEGDNVTAQRGLNLTKKQKENCKHNSKESFSGNVFPVNDISIILWDFNMISLVIYCNCPTPKNFEKNGKKIKFWRKLRQETDTTQCSLFHQTADWSPRQSLAKNFRKKIRYKGLKQSATLQWSQILSHPSEVWKANIWVRMYVDYIITTFNMSCWANTKV